MTKKPLPKQKQSCIADTSYDNEKSYDKTSYVLSTEVAYTSINKPHICTRTIRIFRIANESEAMVMWRNFA